MSMQEKIKNTSLFPDNIKQFLLESFNNKGLDENILSELNDMFNEERIEIDKIDNNKNKKLNKLKLAC